MLLCWRTHRVCLLGQPVGWALTSGLFSASFMLLRSLPPYIPPQASLYNLAPVISTFLPCSATHQLPPLLYLCFSSIVWSLFSNNYTKVLRGQQCLQLVDQKETFLSLSDLTALWNAEFQPRLCPRIMPGHQKAGSHGLIPYRTAFTKFCFGSMPLAYTKGQVGEISFGITCLGSLSRAKEFFLFIVRLM